MHYHSRYLKKNFDPNRRRPNRKVNLKNLAFLTIYGKPLFLAKTIEIEEESNVKFSMNPYLKSKSYVAKHGGKMRTDEGNLFMGIVNWSGVAQSVVQGQK